MKPLNNRVIVKQDEKETKTAGDKVLFAKYAGSEVKHNDETYLVMCENDIIAIV